MIARDYELAMDRRYPSYTLADLEKAVAAGRGTPEMMQEIADRKSGASVIKVTPQILGGKAQTRVGRM
jgi:N-methylhydantoinase B/oxoprolinase/acetone carboxylase alpha subunit